MYHLPIAIDNDVFCIKCFCIDWGSGHFERLLTW